jgi:hypothetical protein
MCKIDGGRTPWTSNAVAPGAKELISPDAFSPPYPLLFEATIPRRYARSDARDGGAPTSDIRTRHPALEPRVSASACTDLRGNAMRWGSAIRICRNFLVRRTTNDDVVASILALCSCYYSLSRAVTISFCRARGAIICLSVAVFLRNCRRSFLLSRLHYSSRASHATTLDYRWAQDSSLLEHRSDAWLSFYHLAQYRFAHLAGYSIRFAEEN